MLSASVAISIHWWSDLLLPAASFRRRASFHLETETLPICASHGNNATTIQSFLSQMELPHDWLLLKWNPDGSFDADHMQSKSISPQWAPSAELLGDTKPSPFGRVALLLNSDRIPLVNWTIKAPVPVWVYSKPTSAFDPGGINVSEPPEPCDLDGVTVVANPYDTGNWNKVCVELVEKTVVTHNFTEKINKIVWRGGIHSPQVEQSRMALLEFTKRQLETDEHGDWIDVHEVNNKDDPNHLELGELAEYRYQLDLGGLSGTAWGGLRWKMCSGLLVFKVQSWASDWWYDTLSPWVHYIPVRSDVSDLYEQYQWAQEHPARAETMAEAGRLKCLETFGPEAAKAQYRSVVQSLQEAHPAIVKEADDLLDQLISLDTDFAGLPSIESSKAWWRP